MSWPLNRIQHFFSVLTARFVNLGPAAEGNNNGLIELARQTDPILCFGRHALVSVRHSRRKSVEQKARRQVTGLIWGGKGSNLLVPTAPLEAASPRSSLRQLAVNAVSCVVLCSAAHNAVPGAGARERAPVGASRGSPSVSLCGDLDGSDRTR